jgi:hypothetical protein
VRSRRARAELRDDLKARRFQLDAVREVMIPKPGGKRRRLGIATVRDRVVQAALKTVLEPIFEAEFMPCSYGFRPASVALHPLPGVNQHSGVIHEAVEIIEPAIRIIDSPLVQLGLDLQYPRPSRIGVWPWIVGIHR